eukprot:2550272-Prymnesium_polylepis.2
MRRRLRLGDRDLVAQWRAASQVRQVLLLAARAGRAGRLADLGARGRRHLRRHCAAGQHGLLRAHGARDSGDRRRRPRLCDLALFVHVRQWHAGPRPAGDLRTAAALAAAALAAALATPARLRPQRPSTWAAEPRRLRRWLEQQLERHLWRWHADRRLPGHHRCSLAQSAAADAAASRAAASDGAATTISLAAAA